MTSDEQVEHCYQQDLILGRRDALKKAAVGAAAAGLVWSAPRVEGLTLRPNYAAAASGVLTVTYDTATGLPGTVTGAESCVQAELKATVPAGSGSASIAGDAATNAAGTINSISLAPAGVTTENSSITSSGNAATIAGVQARDLGPVTLSVGYTCS